MYDDYVEEVQLASSENVEEVPLERIKIKHTA